MFDDEATEKMLLEEHLAEEQEKERRDFAARFMAATLSDGNYFISEAVERAITAAEALQAELDRK